MNLKTVSEIKGTNQNKQENGNCWQSVLEPATKTQEKEPLKP